MKPSLFKRPGAKCELSRAVVQFGIRQELDTLILTGKYNYRKVPLWAPAELIARRAGCSRRTAYRWRWMHDLFVYGTDVARQSRRAA